MNYRISEILASKTLAESGTEVIPIHVKDPISAIFFEYKNTNGSVTQRDHVAGCLSKIELVDGSDVIFSLSGKQLHALDYYDKKQTPYTHIANFYGVQQLLGMSYNFGRKLWDPMLVFDPTRYDNPQLKITHNQLASDASASAHSLRILGFLFDEKVPSPVGFLSAREVIAYASGDDDSYKYIDLPTDRVVRKMLIYAYDGDYSPHLVVSQIKISEDNDKRVVVDEPCSLLQKAIMSEYPPWRETILADLSVATRDIYVTPGFSLTIDGKAQVTAVPVDVETGVLHSPVGIGMSTPGAAQLSAVGYLPHSIVPVLFGVQDDIDDWYDVTKVGSLRAILQAGSAGAYGEVAVFLQQLRRY